MNDGFGDTIDRTDVGGFAGPDGQGVADNSGVDKPVLVAPVTASQRQAAEPDAEKTSVGILDILSFTFGKNPMLLTPEQQANVDKIFGSINDALAKAPVLIEDAEKIVNDITKADNALTGIVAALPDIMKLISDVEAAVA